MVRWRSTRFVGATVLLMLASILVTVAPSSGAQGDQFTLFKGTFTQSTNQYANPAAGSVTQPADYTSPNNYADGNVYYRIEVLQKPSDLDIYAQLCFWRHTEAQRFKYETCTKTAKPSFHFSDEGVYYVDAGAPNKFWKKNNTYDWAEQASITRFMLFDSSSRKLLVGSSCGGACYPRDDLSDHVPIRFKAEVIFVKKGAELDPPSDWSGCPSSWSSQCGNGGGGGTTTTTTAPNTTTTTSGGGGNTTTTLPSSVVPDVTLNADGNSFSASWPAVSGATLYQVRYRKVGASNWKWIPVSSATTASASGLSSATQYEVDVRAYVPKSWRAWSENNVTTSGGSTTTTAPPQTTTTTTAGPTTTTTAPASGGVVPVVSLSSGNGSFTASWDAVPGATLYQVRYRKDGIRAWTWVPLSSATSVTRSGLDGGSQYDVHVRAYVSPTWRSWSRNTVTPS